MGGAYTKYGIDKKCMHNFNPKILREEAVCEA
jgi:hypothetical protein